MLRRIFRLTVIDLFLSVASPAPAIPDKGNSVAANRALPAWQRPSASFDEARRNGQHRC
jgi:hypothetical protein